MRSLSLVSALCLVALMALASPAGAARHKPPAVQLKCPKGFSKVKTTVTRHGKKKIVFHCRKKQLPTSPPDTPAPATPASTGSASAAAPAASPAPGRQASTTTLSATYQVLPPERLGIIEYRIGQYTLTGAVTPFAVPDLRCNGLAGCIEPAGSLQGGSLTVPVLGRLEYEKRVAKWKVGVAPAQGTPTWLTLTEAASGTRYFQASGAPDPSAYLPSTAQAPIALANPHLPGAIRHEGELNGPVGEAFESFAIVGDYKKIGGTDYDLVVESNESVSATSSSGCKFQTRINGVVPTTGLEWSDGYNESTFANRISSSWRVEVYARHEGGTANCGLNNEDTYVVTERPHG